MIDTYAIQKGAAVVQYLSRGGEKPQYSYQWEAQILECARIYLAIEKFIRLSVAFEVTNNGDELSD